jgi:Uma2 family endonuclease
VRDNPDVSTLPAPRHFTVSEYLRLAEVGVIRPGERVELIDGQIVATTPQGPVHSALVSGIVARLNEIFPRDEFCVRPQSTLVLGEDEAPEPDVAVVAGPCEEHQAELPRSALLVVEVADTSLPFDRGRKADLYARGGVPEYWVVDVKGASVEIRRDPGPAGYATTRVVRGDDAVLPLALEGRAFVPLRAADLLPRHLTS